MNIFETAARKAFRFESNKGLVTTEDLFQLPLTALDKIAQSVNRDIKASEEESFVSPRTLANTLLQAKLEVVKYVIADRQAGIEAQEAAEAERVRKAKIRDILSRKQENELEGKSVEELEALLGE